ncbi:hypothetical protein GQ54DRAFT_309237 [Martensiomyces pterosporus]|nr:hypothetical protein GQ54DRAFT_309237 [Martensiomyces pterosporus]
MACKQHGEVISEASPDAGLVAMANLKNQNPTAQRVDEIQERHRILRLPRHQRIPIIKWILGTIPCCPVTCSRCGQERITCAHTIQCTNAYEALEHLVTKNKDTRTIRDNPIDNIIKNLTKDNIADRAEAVAQVTDAIWTNCLGYTSLVKQHRKSP